MIRRGDERLNLWQSYEIWYLWNNVSFLLPTRRTEFEPVSLRYLTWLRLIPSLLPSCSLNCGFILRRSHKTLIHISSEISPWLDVWKTTWRLFSFSPSCLMNPAVNRSLAYWNQFQSCCSAKQTIFKSSIFPPFISCCPLSSFYEAWAQRYRVCVCVQVELTTRTDCRMLTIANANHCVYVLYRSSLLMSDLAVNKKVAHVARGPRPPHPTPYVLNQMYIKYT